MAGQTRNPSDMAEDNSSSSLKTTAKSTPSKRTKTYSEDRLSALPDSPLVEILSLLEMEDAVKTGVLCKRWQRLWTLVHRISYRTFFDKPGPAFKKFVSFVDYSLSLCTCPHIKLFSIEMPYSTRCSDAPIEKWLRLIANKNVEILKIGWFENNNFAPEWFLPALNPVKLQLEYWGFELNQSVCWTKLRILKLVGMYIDDQAIAKILSGSPVLEHLEFFGNSHVCRLNITSPNLKSLKVDEFSPGEDDEGYQVLEIYAPWLQHLEISGGYFGHVLRLTDVSSLGSASLTFRFNWFAPEDLCLNLVSQLARSVSHVEKLTLGHTFVQAVWLLTYKGMLSPLFKCKHLTLKSCTGMEFTAITYILESSPDVETILVKNVEPVRDSWEFSVNDLGKDFLKPRVSNFTSVSDIKFTHRRGLCFQKDFEAVDQLLVSRLSSYLMVNAPSLKKLFVSTSTTNCEKCSTNCASHSLSAFSHFLIGHCIHEKPGAVWDFKKDIFHLELTFRDLHLHP